MKKKSHKGSCHAIHMQNGRKSFFFSSSFTSTSLANSRAPSERERQLERIISSPGETLYDWGQLCHRFGNQSSAISTVTCARPPPLRPTKQARILDINECEENNRKKKFLAATWPAIYVNLQSFLSLLAFSLCFLSNQIIHESEVEKAFPRFNRSRSILRSNLKRCRARRLYQQKMTTSCRG